MINRKVILPWGAVKMCPYFNRLELGDKSYDLYDLDKVMANLDGYTLKDDDYIRRSLEIKFNQLRSLDSYRLSKEDEIESKYFKIRFYKKGTLHLYFKDKQLWDFFNLQAMKGKNWLPPGKKVDDMKFVDDIPELVKEPILETFEAPEMLSLEARQTFEEIPFTLLDQSLMFDDDDQLDKQFELF
jgi:Domain of unknown function (DUF4942)